MDKDALTTKMSKLQDEDLVQIAFTSDTESFEDGYVEAAMKEIERRKIEDSELENLKSDMTGAQESDEWKKYEPLSPFGRAIFFIFGALWLAWLATAILKFRGYDQKFRDAWRWIFYGFGFLLAVALIFSLADSSFGK